MRCRPTGRRASRTSPTAFPHRRGEESRSSPGQTPPHTPRNAAAAPPAAAAGRNSHTTSHSPAAPPRHTAPSPTGAGRRRTGPPGTARTRPAGLVPRRPGPGLAFPAQVSPDSLAIAAKMAGDSRYRPSPPPQCLHFHVFSLCEHRAKGSFGRRPRHRQARRSPRLIQRTSVTTRRGTHWGDSVIEAGEIPLIVGIQAAIRARAGRDTCTLCRVLRKKGRADCRDHFLIRLVQAMLLSARIQVTVPAHVPSVTAHDRQRRRVLARMWHAHGF